MRVKWWNRNSKRRIFNNRYLNQYKKLRGNTWKALEQTKMQSKRSSLLRSSLLRSSLLRSSLLRSSLLTKPPTSLSPTTVTCCVTRVRLFTTSLTRIPRSISKKSVQRTIAQSSQRSSWAVLKRSVRKTICRKKRMLAVMINASLNRQWEHLSNSRRSNAMDLSNAQKSMSLNSLRKTWDVLMRFVKTTIN